jgi:formylglycine-generating enzyme required for sulfatase activity
MIRIGAFLFALILLALKAEAADIKFAFSGGAFGLAEQVGRSDPDFLPVSGTPLGKAIEAAANGAFLDFQKKCDRGSRPLPETIAFVGIPEHHPSISESTRRALNAQIINSAGAGLVRPTEMSTLKLLAPFLSLDKKGQDQMKAAEERIAGSPLAILVEIRRPSIEILELDLSFLDKRPGCSDSVVRTFFVKLSTFETIEDRLPSGDDEIYELLGFYYKALGQFARPLSSATKTLTAVHFQFDGQCDPRREAKPIFETTYQQLRNEVSILLDNPVMPPLNDGDFAETPDAALPDNAALIRLRFMPSSISKRLASSTIEFVYKGAKQYVLHANVVVDERYLSGCEASSQPDEAKNLTVERDCPGCPEMLVVAGGNVMIGSPDAEAGRSADEGPMVPKQVKSVAIARYETTVGEFEAFLAATGYIPSAMSNRAASYCSAPGQGDRWTKSNSRSHRMPGFPQTRDHPVVCVSWDDARAYAFWLSTRSGKPYRVPSETEYEYMARAGTRTAYWWGDAVDPRLANYELTPGHTSQGLAGTMSTASLTPNPWGFYHVSGNAAEWTEDCWNDRHSQVPATSDARITGDCTNHVIRGGGWTYRPDAIRSAARDHAASHESFVDVGFRVARDLTR